MARNKKYEEPVGMGGEEDVVSHAEDFRLDDIDFDEAYDQLKDEPPEMDEKTQKSILKLRREVELEDKYVAKLRKRNRTRWVRAFVIPLCIVAVSAGIALMIMAGIRDMIGIEKNEFYREELEITEGMTADQVADLLGEKGIINYPWLFKIIVKLDGVGQNFQAGMHEFYPHDSYSELVVELETTPERTDVADVMIPEGYTLPQIAQTLEVNGICSAADFIKTVNSMEIPYDFASSIDQDALKFYRVEGYLFPDQYRFYLNEKPEVVANKFFENFQAKIAPYEEQIAQSGYTLEEVVTLASIIQCEAADEEQMKTISSVFHNRLKSGFPASGDRSDHEIH